MTRTRREFLRTGGLFAAGSFLGPSILTKMELQSFPAAGDLGIVASRSSSQNDFDFLVGKWRVHNRKLKTRLNNSNEWSEYEASVECRKILDGFGNIDSFKSVNDGKPFEGMALRLFNPKTRLWSIYWANSVTVVLDVPQVGSFENRQGRFYARDSFDGKVIIVQYYWDATNPDIPRWSQAFSADNGRTWEWNWYMSFHRQGAAQLETATRQISQAKKVATRR